MTVKVKGKIWPSADAKPWTDRHQIWNTWLRHGYLSPQKWGSIRPGVLPHIREIYTQNVRMFTSLFLGSSESLQTRSLDRFSRLIVIYDVVLRKVVPSSSIWPHMSYGLVSSNREYCPNCSLAVVLCIAFCSCTVIWAAHRFCLPDLASSHWVHSLCLDYFVNVRLCSCIISACMLYYCNMVRWAWLDWGLSGWLTTLL